MRKETFSDAAPATFLLERHRSRGALVSSQTVVDVEAALPAASRVSTTSRCLPSTAT